MKREDQQLNYEAHDQALQGELEVAEEELEVAEGQIQHLGGAEHLDKKVDGVEGRHAEASAANAAIPDHLKTPLAPSASSTAQLPGM